ncbi:MAG: ABC transporter ATP-binding protein [Candidatus Bathyarchaeia archaeon]|jgi:ATP-binding cassette subfamily B protein
MSREFSDFSTKTEEARKRTVSDVDLIKRLYNYAEGFRRNFLIGMSTIVMTAVTSLTIPYLHLVVIDDIITPKDLSGFMWWIPIFLFVTAAHYLVQYTQIYQMRIVGENVVAKMRDQMIRKLQQISLRYFSEGELGRILSRPVNDANVVRIFIRQGLAQIVLDVSSIVGSLLIIFFINTKLALIAVSILPFAVILAWSLGKISRKYYRRVLLYTSGMVAKIQENLSGIKVIKAFTQEERTSKGFVDTQDKVYRTSIRTVAISSSYQPVLLIMRIIGTILILYFGAVMAMSGEITIGILVAFTEYQFQYFQPLLDLITQWDQYQSSMSAIERMFDLIDTTVEIQEPSQETAINIEHIEEVEFDDVTFGYDKNIPVLKNISFTLSKGKKMAFVGPTGAGKSTIINLISKFYMPLGGEVLINGHNMKDITTESLRAHMSIVLQDSFLFAMSVRDNIRFGKPESSDDEVVAAAKSVGAHDFIMKLPGGYDYILKEGSSNISIGQRQLISFARTLLMDPDLLILDEATSSIDPYTELVIQNALKALLANRMAILIAHRLSTIRLCDEILVIDHGVVVERGSHFVLMASGGLYSSFYKMQFKEESGMAGDSASTEASTRST